MSLRIGIITNPHSKLNKRNPLRPKLLSYILGQKGRLEVTASVADLEGVAIRFLQQKISILAINGGDGTISLTLSAFIKVCGQQPLPKIALLRGGTMNVIAHNLGIRGKPEEILALLLEKSSSQEPLDTCKLPMLTLEGRYGFIYADGTHALILQEFYANKTDKLGAWWLAVRLAISAIFQGKLSKKLFKTQQICFQAHPHPKQNHYSSGCFVTTLGCLPLNLPMFSKNIPKDSFQAISINCPAEDLIWKFPAMMLSQTQGRQTGKISRFCQRLTIQSRNDSPYTLDGELYEPQSKNLEITVGPQIEFLQIGK